MGSRFALFVPLLLFVALALFLFRGLSLDPRELPSALIDEPLPQFQLPSLDGKVLTRRDLIGTPALLNVWATWCISCRVEHAYLQNIADSGVRIFGLNYKDDTEAALNWLAQLGNPYVATVVDAEGSLGLDLGVYGAPETYLLDAEGTIRYRHVGVVDERVWMDVLGPRYRALNQSGTGR